MSVAYRYIENDVTLNELINNAFLSIVNLCDKSNLTLSHYAFEFIHELQDTILEKTNLETSHSLETEFSRAYEILQDLLMCDSDYEQLKNDFLKIGNRIARISNASA